MEAELSAARSAIVSSETGAAAEYAPEPDSIAQIAPGKVGIWWFLASETMVFGGLIGCFVLMRIAHRGWAAESAHVNWRLGAINTPVLVTSSLTMILAHTAFQSDDRPAVAKYLGATVALGLVFLGIKSFEYSREIAEGFTPVTGLFSFYYTMTGLHDEPD